MLRGADATLTTRAEVVASDKQAGGALDSGGLSGLPRQRHIAQPALFGADPLPVPDSRLAMQTITNKGLLSPRGSSAQGLPARAPLPWDSPLTHGLGSSWHSADSAVVLWFFCRMDWLVVTVVGILVLMRTRSRCNAAAAASLVALTLGLQGLLGLNLFEGLICRPWIWLIMA